MYAAKRMRCSSLLLVSFEKTQRHSTSLWTFVRKVNGESVLGVFVFTPIKLGTVSLLVPLLIMVWAMNPLGGQLSLRVVSKETNVTTISTPFLYVSPSLSWDKRAMGGGNPSNDRAIENVFTTALPSLNSSKNGTQDAFGNVQIPLLEYLTLNDTGDSDGWLHTMDCKNGVITISENTYSLMHELLSQDPKPPKAAVITSEDADKVLLVLSLSFGSCYSPVG